MVNQNSSPKPARMLVFEYTALIPAGPLQDAVRLALKSPTRLAGFEVDDDCITITDIHSGAHARVICDVPGMLRIQSPSEMRDIVSNLVNRLIGRRVVELRPYTAKARVDEVKPFTPAKDILAAHMAETAFAKVIDVLPEALAGAATCKFRKDGALDRYLRNLVRFAEAALDPANARKSPKFLAGQCGLSHFGEGVGTTALRDYPEDYTATYRGVPRLFPMHVTIGVGRHEEDCMSIHFLVDREAGKLVIARFGRHGRGLNSN